ALHRLIKVTRLAIRRNHYGRKRAPTASSRASSCSASSTSSPVSSAMPLARRLVDRPVDLPGRGAKTLRDPALRRHAGGYLTLGPVAGQSMTSLSTVPSLAERT